jgi:hypothetical protein
VIRKAKEKMKGTILPTKRMPHNQVGKLVALFSSSNEFPHP